MPAAGPPWAVSRTCVLREAHRTPPVLESEQGDLAQVVDGLVALGLVVVAEPALELGEDLVARGRPPGSGTRGRTAPRRPGCGREPGCEVGSSGPRRPAREPRRRRRGPMPPARRSAGGRRAPASSSSSLREPARLGRRPQELPRPSAYGRPREHLSTQRGTSRQRAPGASSGRSSISRTPELAPGRLVGVVPRQRGPRSGRRAGRRRGTPRPGSSMPNGERSTRRWCLFGAENEISARSGCASSTACPSAQASPAVRGCRSSRTSPAVTAFTSSYAASQSRSGSPSSTARPPSATSPGPGRRCRRRVVNSVAAGTP